MASYNNTLVFSLPDTVHADMQFALVTTCTLQPATASSILRRELNPMIGEISCFPQEACDSGLSHSLPSG